MWCRNLQTEECHHDGHEIQHHFVHALCHGCCLIVFRVCGGVHQGCHDFRLQECGHTCHDGHDDAGETQTTLTYQWNGQESFDIVLCIQQRQQCITAVAQNT